MVLAIGSLCGLLIAFVGARMMKSLLYGVSTSDPITFTGVGLALVRHQRSRLLDPGPQS